MDRPASPGKGSLAAAGKARRKRPREVIANVDDARTGARNDGYKHYSDYANTAEGNPARRRAKGTRLLQHEGNGPQLVSAAMHSPTMRSSPRRLPTLPKQTGTRALANLGPNQDHHLLQYTSKAPRRPAETLAQYQTLLGKLQQLAKAKHAGEQSDMRTDSENNSDDTTGVLENERDQWSRLASREDRRASYLSALDDLAYGHLAFDPMSTKPAQHLDLRHWREAVSDHGLDRLTSCTRACRDLDLRGLESLTDGGLIRAVGNCPNLERLRIAGCKHLSDAGIESALSICGNTLVELDLAKYATAPLGRNQEVVVGDDELDQLWCKCCKGPMLQCADESRAELLRADMRRSPLNISARTLAAVAQHCPSLEILVLREQREIVSNLSIALLAKSCVELRCLDLGDCLRIGQEALRPLGEACGRNLQDIRMEGCNHVNDEGLHCLAAKAFSLRYVDLSGLQKISDDGLRMFMDYKTMWGHREHPGFQNVRTVILRGCQDITDISLGWIASGCPRLETLDMQGCRNLGDFGMRSIGGLNHLKVLNMSRCKGISDAGVLQLVSNAKVEFGLRALPELHTVVFSSCPRISSKSLSALVETLATSLTRLEVADTGPVSDEFVRLVALHCGPRLGVLRLAGHNEITAAGLGALGKRCKYLYDLDVSRCALVGNDSLLALQPLRHVRALHLSRCPSLKGVLAVPNWKLQVLALCECADLNDASLVTLLGLCQELRTLEVGGCAGLTSHAFEVVAARRRSDMPPGLDMVNVHGCSLVSDATMRRLASACSDFGLACSFVKNASWRGIQPDLERVRALHAERQVKRKAEMEQAALVVQCLVRRRRAYKVLQDLRHEDFQRRVAAAIEMQRCARGYLARVFAAELRQVLTFLALRIQFMYRQYHAAKVTRRALAIWTQRLLSRCFFAWRENAESLILERRTAAAMQLAAEALAHFSGALVKRSWTQWQAYVAHRRWKNERYPKAQAFFASRASRRCFDDWKENARPGILRRKNLVKVFLLCVPLEVRNAQVARSNVFTAKRYFRRSTRSTAFRGLKAVAKQAKRNIELADELRYKHFLAQPHGPAAEILHWWRKFTVYKLEIAAKARVLVARLAQRRQALALRQLAYLAGRRALYQEQRELARELFGNVVSQKAFRRWVEAVQEAREMRAKAQKALAFMKDATLARTLRAWRAAITLRKSQEERIGQALARISQRTLVVALQSWKSAVAARKDFRRRAIQRMAMRTASRCLSQWKVFAVEERVRRCAQLASWKLLNRTVVRIQARWRGVLGREQVEDTRLMAQLMATRIQQFSRMVLAKKRAFRAERMRILHDYVAAEREQDLMAIEDYVAQEMQREFKAARLVQRHFRARYARDMAYYAKRELARAREIRRRERQHELMLEHEAKVAARQKEQERREAIASKIQAAARGMLARKRYMVLWARSFLGRKATMIQCAFRQRAAMHRYAATKRWSRLLRETARQQRTNARALRAMMLRNRSQQKMAQGPLDALGIHPDTFTLDLAKLRKEVLVDFRDWTRFARSEFEAYRHARFNANKRQEIIRAFYERVRDEQWIRKGDAIRIISRQSPYRGETGFVLNVYEVATVPGGAQAAVKLDRNGAILFVPLMTVPTASEDSVSSMIRVKRLDKDWAKSKVTPELVASNQEAILAYAQGLAAERRRERAALVIQRHFRGRKWRAYFKEAYVKQQRVDAARQQKLLRILRRLGLENARTGRLLVALGLVWPRYVPEMPDKPFAVEIWARKRQMNYEAWKYRRFQVLLAQDERERRVRMLRRRFRSDGVGPGESDELPAPMPATPSRTATPSNARTPQGTPSNATRANTPSAVATTGDRDPLTEEATSQATALQLAGFSNNHIPLRGQMLMDFMVNTGTNISEEQEAAMPWRVRNPFKAAFWRGVHTLTDRALAPTAERILALSIKKKDAGEIPVSVLLRLLAKAVGGPQWRRSPIERLTWVGVYRFDQLVKSCHVTMDGTAVFHGTWSPWGVPHGVGFLELPEGDGLARIKSKYAIYLLSTSKDEEEGDAFRKLMEDRKLKRKQTWMEKTKRRALDVSRVLNDTSKEEVNELEDDDELEGFYTDTDDEADADPAYVGRKGILATLRSSSEISAQIPQTPVMKRRQNTDSSLEGFSDESGPNDLLYTSIKTTVENGIITGKVTINFKTGEMYEGAYFGESPSAWLMANRPIVERIQLDADDDVESWLPSEEEFDDLPSVNRWTTPTGIVYEGESVTHHFRPSHPQGLMRITWPDDEVYFGEMVEGKKCGLGRSMMHDGDEYKGQWKDDTPHGVGVYYWEESRTAFAGQFVKGVRQGRGRQTFANGSRYDGEFVEDQPTGEGTLTRPNGDLYVGSFVEGEFHGHGLMKYADGTEYEGSWRRGMRHSGLRETSRFVNSEGDIYHVPFVNDEMDGQGSFLQAKLNPWRLERHGVWRRGQLSHWVGVSINKASTDEFCSRFVTYADYSSEYASIVAQSLPELPSGVDPDDRRVEQHVNGILRRAGPLASASIVDRSERALAEFQPLYDSIVGARDTAQANLTQAEEMHKAAKAAVDVQDALFEARSEELAALTAEIKDFWKRGTKAHACKRAYKRAVRKLKQFSTLDWFACKMANFTPPLWTSLWHAIAKIYLTELDKRSVQPSDVERLCNSSSINRDFGEHSALLRDYDIKLLDEIEQYNVYERSKAKNMLRDVVSTVHHRDLNPRNSELAQICGLASPLVAFLHASYNYTMAAKGIAHVMDAALIKLDETDRVRALLRDCKENLHTCEIQVHDCDRAHQLADLEVRNSEVRLHEIQLNLKRARECQELAAEGAQADRLVHKFTRLEERDEDPIFPWISREEEVIFNACLGAVEYMLDLVCNIEPEVWDCVWTLKEITVGHFQYQDAYGVLEDDPEFVPEEVRDAVGDLVNCVAGFRDGAELEVHDALNDILYTLQGGAEPEVCEALDTAVNLGIEKFLFEDRAEKRQAKFKDQRVVVTIDDPYGGPGIRKFGLCLETYDYQMPIPAPPMPGTGVIYCEVGDTQVYGFEDTCQFLSEIRIGDVLCLPDADSASGIAERAVVGIWYDYHLEIEYPFPDALVAGGWTKQWAFRQPDAVLEYIPKEMVSVQLDEGAMLEVELDHVERADDGQGDQDSDEDDSEEEDSEENTSSLDDDDDDDDDDAGNTGAAGVKGQVNGNVEGTERRRRRSSSASRNRRGSRASRASRSSSISGKSLEIWQRFEDESGNAYWSQINSDDVAASSTWEQPLPGPRVWFQYEDEATGFFYFHNPATNETTWIEPF